MIEKDDWRLQGQEKYLTGVKLIRIPFTPLSKTWDHEHCEFCWAKFSNHEDDLHNGYVAEDKHVWICPECYEDFKEMFRWELVEPQ